MEKDEARFRLIEAIATNAIAMVGAGSSIRVGYPLWPRLMDQLSDETEVVYPGQAKFLASIKDSDDLLLRAGEYERLLGRDVLRTKVLRAYGPESAPFDEFHRTLLRMPFRHYLTSNYDRVVESTHRSLFDEPAHFFDFNQRSELQEFIDRCRAEDYPRAIVHVHGSIGDPDEIILTLNDYDRRYQNEKWATQALVSIFTLYPCVFIGCGLGADDLGPLRFLTAVLGGGSATKHFAIMEQPPQEKEALLRVKLASRYRIEPVFYPSSKGHQALEPFMQKLLEDVEAYRKKLDARNQDQLQNALAAKVAPLFADDVDKFTKFNDACAEVIRGLGRPAIQSSSWAVASAGVPKEEERTPFDDEIDAAFEYVKSGQATIALELYRNMLRRENHRLTARLRYRIHANIGNAYYHMDAKEDAAREYLIAASLRDTCDARALEALAYVLREDFGKSRELAESLRSEHPEFARGHWLLIVSLPRQTPFRDAEALAPFEIRKDSEVAHALSGLAIEQDLLDEAEFYGRLAIQTAPTWADAILNLAAVLLLAEKKTAIVNIGIGLTPKKPERVAEAELLTTRAIALLPKSYSGRRIGTAFLNRSSAKRFLGKMGAADDDSREAYRHAPAEPDVVIAFALMLERHGDLNGAIEALTSCAQVTSHWKPTFVFAALLRRRGAVKDYEDALSLLTLWKDQVTRIGLDEAFDLAELATEIYLEMNQPQKADEFVNALPATSFPPGHRDILLGKIAFKTGDQEGAKLCLHAAAASLPISGDWFARREAAVLAESLGEIETAIALWKDLLPRTLFNADALHVLHLAWAIQDDAFILNFCRDLHNAGIEDRHITEFEVNTLVRCRESAKAVSLAKEWLLRHPDDSNMRVNLSLIAIERGEMELVETDPARLPAVTAVSDAKMGAAISHVLQYGTTPTEAAKYAYELCRRFPDNATAHGSLIFAIFGPTPKPVELAQPTTVGPDVAVIYREFGSEGHLVAIAETSPNPSLSRMEYAMDHPLIQAMIGLAPGADFHCFGRKHTILAVANKILYRAQDYMQSFDRNFPEMGIIRRFTMPTDVDDPTDPKKMLGEAWDILEAGDKRQQQLEAIYAANPIPIPIPLLAQGFGRSVIETMQYLAAKRGVPIRCATVIGWQSAVASLGEAKAAVLDSTAVATIYMLGLHAHLKQLPFRCIVPEGVIQEIRSVVQGFDRSSRQRGYLGVHQGKLFFQEASVGDETAWIQSLENLVEKLKSDCEVVGGSAILELDPEHRKGLTKIVGPGVADAIAIARQKGAVLWTDDFTVGEVARNEWKIARIWTDLVLHISRTGLGARISNAGTAKLMVWGYEWTPLTVGAAMELLRDAKWRLDHWAALPAVNQISQFAGLNRNNAEVTALLFHKVWHGCPKERVAKMVIKTLLNKIGRGIAGPAIARRLYRHHVPLVGNGRTAKNRRLARFLRCWRCDTPRPH